MIHYVGNFERERESCPLNGAIGNLPALLLQVRCINEGLILSLECIGYPRSSSENVLLSSVSSIVCVAAWGAGYLLNLSDQLRRKFSKHRPFEGGC